MEWVCERFKSSDTCWNVEKLNDNKIWPMYRISPAAYSFAGLYFWIISLYFGALYPGHYIDSVLLIIQGVFSYLGDVYFFGRPHNTRVVDRILAIIFMGQFIIRNFFVGDIIQTWLYIIYTTGSLYCYYKSYTARKLYYLNTYLIWHTLWHLGGPSGLCVWISYLLYIR